MKSEENTHAGHRERMRRKWDEAGADAFRDHELLEMALFFCISRGNTNPTAHALMERFGSLRGVFEAPLDELMQVPGVGRTTAQYLKLIFEFCRRIHLPEEKTVLLTKESICDYLHDLYLGQDVECVRMLLLDKQHRLIRTAVISEGTLNNALIDLKRVVQIAAARSTVYVILAHNHPSGVPSASADDIAFTVRASSLLEAMEITLIDHYIVANDQCYGICSREHIPACAGQTASVSKRKN